MILPNLATAIQNNNSFPVIWNVQNANEFYVGREPLIKELYRTFQKQSNEVVIVGSAGIGKTQLAKKYAEIYRGQYDIVWWFDVGKNLGEQYIRLVNEWNRINNDQTVHINIYLPQDEIIRQIKEYLRVTELNWLLIFDNVNEKSQINTYIPIKHNKSLGNILITSKNPYTWNNVVKLDKFKRNESTELILKITNENNAKQSDRLASILGDYPLAIAQAASYIKSQPGLNIEEYTNLFLTNRERLWIEESKNHEKYVAFDNYKFTVFTTLALIAEEIKKESHDAFELLIFCSYLNSKNLPESLLKHYVSKILKIDIIGFRSLLAILAKYSLINQNSNLKSNTSEVTYTIHELSQLTVQDMLNEQEKKQYIEKDLLATASFLPDKIDILLPYLSQHHYFLLNIEAITNHALQAEIYNNNFLTIQIRLLEYILSGKRDFSASQEIRDRIELLMKKNIELNPILKVRFAIMNSAFQAWYKLDYKESLKYALVALETINNIPHKNEDTLMVYNRLSQTYNMLGDNDSALKYAKMGEALAISDQSLGNQDALYQALGKAFEDKGDFASAIKYAQKSVDKVASPNSKMVAGDLPTYVTKAIILIKMARYEEAFQLLKGLSYEADKIFGKIDHFYKAIIDSYYAYVWFKYKNEFLNTKRLLLHSRKVLSVFLGENVTRNRYISTNHKFVGEIYENEKDYIKAQQEYAKALQILTNYYDGHKKATDDFSDLYTRLAIINVKLGDTVTAQHYLDLHIKDFGYEHPRTMEITKYFIDNKMSVEL